MNVLNLDVGQQNRADFHRDDIIIEEDANTLESTRAGGAEA
jgi:hypothetical protein